ncbi:Peptidoglycan/xylan/chitin deacetylase, PgdA/CDA1 family [Marininema mesophilum]|uniref:Peptidoglycan/xylan/chitin deacetylase, PgdA/CDA1 family n=1 Tax=Marininema mesophilum TaxID=1048340 RepID=A0A1H2RXJ3_9BACL|nr:polysaccharide deacetylase family protein [Marininema mesophilum]SDW23329.1 Peptidoglycan/xylan/chitin deacetylase, PgdA/CDA1 family [Marininema mesophilum]
MKRNLWVFFLLLTVSISCIWIWNATSASEAEKTATKPTKKVEKKKKEKKRDTSKSADIQDRDQQDKDKKKQSEKGSMDKDKLQPNDPDRSKKSSKKEPITPAVIYQGPKNIKQIALTFDDGPDGTYTPEILDILRKKRVYATFFVIGKEVRKHPKVAKKIVKENHVIASHTWDHPFLPKLSNERINGELDRNYREVYKYTGKKMSLLRPPYGATKGIEKKLAQKGYRIINWNVDSRDWTRPSPSMIQQTVLNGGKAGSIILLHSGGGDRSRTVAALPGLIDKLRQQGYQFTTVDRLIGISPYRN